MNRPTSLHHLILSTVCRSSAHAMMAKRWAAYPAGVLLDEAIEV